MSDTVICESCKVEGHRADDCMLSTDSARQVAEMLANGQVARIIHLKPNPHKRETFEVVRLSNTTVKDVGQILNRDDIDTLSTLGYTIHITGVMYAEPRRQFRG